MSDYQKNYQAWLASDCLTAEEKEELLALKHEENEIKERFSSYLSFGTAGLRGTMKVGMNAMNVHTVAHATQGMAALIKKLGREQDKVVIAYDSRIHSELFAKTAAQVMAANGIPAYLFDAPCPTPELSFALLSLGCVAGINITASHNPKEYNGFKAYWEDGAQLPPEHADAVSREIYALDIFADVKKADFDTALADGRITMIGEEMDRKYLDAVKAQAVNPMAIARVSDELKIVYTPLHGAGHRLVPMVLTECGLKHLYTVPEQMILDGSFPTLKKPNPEFPEAFTLGIAIANEVGSDLVVATDPDADRVGVVTRATDGSFVTITGNQMGALLLDYIITAYEETGTMPKNPFAVKTIVSSELITKICAAHDVTLFNVLTGFKFIGEMIKKYDETGKGSYIFGFEESYGYLKGTYARDKDAVVATMLICEMTAFYKAKNMTLFDALNALYDKYGFYREANEEIYMTGLSGAERMKAFMNELRATPLSSLGSYRVCRIGDYENEIMIDTATGQQSSTGLPRSNVLYYELENTDVVVIRPSGTEPKIKFYYLLSADTREGADKKLAEYQEAIHALVN